MRDLLSHQAVAFDQFLIGRAGGVSKTFRLHGWKRGTGKTTVAVRALVLSAVERVGAYAYVFSAAGHLRLARDLIRGDADEHLDQTRDNQFRFLQRVDSTNISTIDVLHHSQVSHWLQGRSPMGIVWDEVDRAAQHRLMYEPHIVIPWHLEIEPSRPDRDGAVIRRRR